MITKIGKKNGLFSNLKQYILPEKSTDNFQKSTVKSKRLPTAYR
jgi:hypothetical protein